MRYVLAKAKTEANASAYRFYVADTLYFIANHKAPIKRLHEILKPEPEETRTAEEIISNIRMKLERLVDK